MHNRFTRIIAWATSVGTALAFAMPAGAIEFFPTPFRYQWKSQSGTIEGDAHVVRANAGDTVAMSLTLTNRSIDSRARVIYGKSTLLAEASPYQGAHELRVGTAGPHDRTYDWVDSSSFIANPDGAANRLAVYDGAAVNPGGDLTLTWNLKIKSTAANGTYDFYAGLVREFDAWARQVDSAGRLLASEDIFWRVIIGGTVTPATGGISVALAAGTPAATNVADAANMDFTKVTLTPASGASVSITSIYVTRSGLSIDSNVENVKLVRVSDGVQVGGTAGGFNANHKAQIFFSPAMVLTSATDFYIRAGILNGATAGNTVALGIADSADIVSNATSVTGAPIVGNLMTIVTLTLGDITIAEFGSVADSTPDVGDTNVITNTFQLTAGATEDITVEQITVLKAGTAANTDTNNIELWNDSTSTTVATFAAWNAESKAVFNFSPALVILKGNSVRFTVRVDIVSGSGLTVNSDVIDGSDALVLGKGNLYGYYITPTISGGWGGQGDNAQTINAGALVISKSASTVPTGNITIADNQNLGTWDFDARGEEIRISELNIDLSGTITEADDESNVRLVDENGNIVAGPVDSSAEVGVSDREIDFTQTFIVPVGVHRYTLKGRIDTSAANGETLAVAITAAGDVIAKTIRTNTTVTATGVPATLNTLTVRGGALASTTLTAPAARNIVPGVTDYIWMTGAFNASGSGEDIRVTAAQFQLTTGATADTEELVNMEIWANLTSGTNSSRGDKFETKVSNTEQPAATTVDGGDVDFTITFTTAVTIKKDAFIEIAFVGDLQASASSAGAGDVLTVAFDTDASDVTSAGVDTGTAVTTAPTGAGQIMTILAGGAVVITVDSSSPLADIMVGGATGKTVAVYRAVANATEALELDQFVVTNDSTGDETSSAWYLYSNRDGSGNLVTPFLAASVPNGATLTFNVPDSTVRIPADGVALFTIKTDVLPVDGTAVVNGDIVDTDIADLTAAGATGTDTDADFTGLGSGQQIPGTGTNGITNADHELYKSRPYVSFAADTPSGALTPTAAGSVTGLVAKINITADAAFDIAFTNDGGAGDDSGITVRVNAVVNDDGVDSGGYSLVNLTDATIVDSSLADIEAGANEAFDFSTADMFIGAGLTKTLALYADTQAFEDTGDSLQIWLDDSTDGFLEFGTTITALSAANGFDVAAIVFRGDKYGGTLVKA